MERVRSPFVTAVATSAMARTWLVKLSARRLTLPVRSFHVPAAPGTLAWPPRRPSTPTSRATVVTWSANVARVSVMLLMVSAKAATSPLALTVSFFVSSPFAGHARHFCSERVQLVHHRVDGVFQLQNFTLHVHGDLAGQVATR